MRRMQKRYQSFIKYLKIPVIIKKQTFEQADEMTDIKRDIFMYGSDKVFRALNSWLIHCSKQNEEDQALQFEAFLHFVLDIRKDLCGGETIISAEDILINLIQDEDEAKFLINKS